MLTTEVRGLPTFQRTTKQAARQIQDLTAENTAAAQVAAREATARAPKKTGYLASTIRGQGTPTEAEVTASAIYAGPIHWGWPDRNITPQPFMLDAFEASRRTWSPFYEQGAVRAVNQVRGV